MNSFSVFMTLIGLVSMVCGKETYLRRDLSAPSVHEEQDLVTIVIRGIIPNQTCWMPAILQHAPYFYYHVKRIDANSIQPSTAVVEGNLVFKLINQNEKDPTDPGKCFEAFVDYYNNNMVNNNPETALLGISLVIDDSKLDTSAPTNAPTGSPVYTKMVYHYERYKPNGNLNQNVKRDGSNPQMIFTAVPGTNVFQASKRQIQFCRSCDPVTDQADSTSNEVSRLEIHTRRGTSTTVLAQYSEDRYPDKFNLRYSLQGSSAYVRELLDKMQYSVEPVNVTVFGTCPGHEDDDSIAYQYENCFPVAYQLLRPFFGTAGADEWITFQCGRNDVHLKKARCVLAGQT